MAIWSDRKDIQAKITEMRKDKIGYQQIADEVSDDVGQRISAESVRKLFNKLKPTDGVDKKIKNSSDIDYYAVKSREQKKKAPADVKGRYFDDERNTTERTRFNPVRVATFDIETTNLNATFGRVLCAVVQFADEAEPHIFRGDSYPTWEKHRSDDSMIVADILACLEEADVLIAYNGVDFDMAMLRTRALIAGLPPVNPKKIIDPVIIARKQLRLHSNRLDAVAQALGTEFDKTPVDFKIWLEASMDGSSTAMDYITEHCIADVYVLEEVAYKMRHYVKQIDAIGSWR